MALTAVLDHISSLSRFLFHHSFLTSELCFCTLGQTGGLGQGQGSQYMNANCCCNKEIGGYCSLDKKRFFKMAM